MTGSIRDQVEFADSIEEEILESLQRNHGDSAVRDHETTLETSQVEDAMILGALSLYYNHFAESGDPMSSIAALHLMSRWMDASSVDKEEWFEYQSRGVPDVQQILQGGQGFQF